LLREVIVQPNSICSCAHSMQGYRFGRPATAAEIEHRLAAPEAYPVTSPDQEIAVAI